MKFALFQGENRPHIGLVTDRGVLDLTAAAQRLGLPLPGSMEELIAAGAEGRRQAEAVRDAATADGQGPWLKEDQITYLPVVTAPQKIVCVGLNYRRHAQESGLPVPEHPVYFPKYANSLIGHGADVAVPAIAQEVDYEVELAVVMGRRCKAVSAAEALENVFGYAVANDLSARDLQRRTNQWTYGKAIDGFLPLGPWLVTADEVGDPQKLQLRCLVNGQVRQDSNTADMVFSVAEIISDLSQIMTLEPSDVILTGTPEGVALGMNPSPWLQHGDEVVCEIDGLGRLVNRIVRPS